MKNKTLAIMGGISIMGTVASQATSVIPQTEQLSGTLYVVDDPSQASFINANATTRVRWTSTPQLGTGTTAELTGPGLIHTSSDYYWTLNSAALVSSSAAIPTTATYVRLDFTLAGGWVAGDKADQIFRSTNLTTGTGSTTPSDQTNLPWDTTAGAAIADGSYSVIFNLDVPDAGTTWTNLRYDFFNETDGNNAPYPNAGGKTFTLTGVTYATAIAPIPEPSVALLGALGMLGLLRRRR